MQSHLMLARYAMLKGDVEARARRPYSRTRQRYVRFAGAGVMALAAAIAAFHLASPGLL